MDDIDDYLAPSQACINPLFQPPKEGQQDATGSKDGNNSMAGTANGNNNNNNVVIPRRKRRTVRRVALDGTADDGGKIPQATTSTSSISFYDESANKKTKKNDPVHASMADCLACSGCVTTAETVLLEQEHSLEKLREKCNEMNTRNQNGHHHMRLRVLTISPASWADLFRHLDVVVSPTSPPSSSSTIIEQLQRQIVTLMNQIINVNVVVDGKLALQWSLEEAAKEFCELYTAQKQEQQRQLQNQKKVIPDPSIPIDSTQTTYYSDGTTAIVRDNAEYPFQNSLPLISGSCPAVVCLVEKSKHPLVTNLATTKSPMAMTGAYLYEQMRDDGLFDHWAIMPCHDKKLEASRKDFTHRYPNKADGSAMNGIVGSSSSNKGTQKDIELVITTKEWYNLIRDWISSQMQQQQQQVVDGMVTKTAPTKHAIMNYIRSLPLADVTYDSIPSLSSLQAKAKQYGDGGIASTPLPVVFATSLNSGAPSPSSDLPSSSIPPMVPFSSGGHADYIFRYAAKHLFQCHIDPNISIWQPIGAGGLPARGSNTFGSQQSTVIRSARMAKRNKMDYYQAILYRHDVASSRFFYSTHQGDSSNPEPVLRFAIANGLQTLQRAFSSLGVVEEGGSDINGISNNSANVTSAFDYVEAMACPSGCVNGGGQLRMNDDENGSLYQASSRETPTQTRQRVSATQDWLKLTATSSRSDNQESSYVQEDMDDTINDGQAMDTDDVQEMDVDDGVTTSSSQTPSSRRTRYHVVPQMKYGLGATAGVAVEDIQW